MNLTTRITIPDKEVYATTVRRCAADTQNLFDEIRAEVSDSPPNELRWGMIAGYLRGRGYTWQQAFTMMDFHMKTTTAANTRAAPSAVVNPPPSLPRHDFRLEMITCSVDCAEYLESSLALNSKHFDHIIVVTTPDDRVSQEIAEKYEASLLITDRFYRGGARFNRGDAYNRALDLLKFNDWVAYVDADIVLDPSFRYKLECHGLRAECFYGSHRRDAITDEAREVLLAGDTSQTIVQSTSEWGFGYLQIFNMQSPWLRGRGDKPIYPSAEDVFLSDHLFRTQFGRGHTMTKDGLWTWDVAHQVCLPFDCYHLGSNGPGTMPSTRKYRGAMEVVAL